MNAFADFAANAVWQSTLIAMAALLLVPLLRWVTPALRHAILAAALICCGVAPFIVFKPAAPVACRTCSPRALPRLPASSPGAAPIVASIYAAMIAIAAIRLAVAMHRARMIVRSAALPLPDSARAAAATLGIDRIRAADIASPVTIGRTILVPLSLDDAAALPVIAHEAAHVRRCDWAIHCATEIVTLAVACNPAVWLLKRATATAREIACDAFVTRSLVAPAQYAETLIAAAHAASRAYAIAFGGSAALEARLRMLRRRMPAAPLSRAIAAVAIAMLAMTTAIACNARIHAFTDFSGHYTLNRSASQFGPIRPLDAFEAWVQQSESTISVRQLRLRAGEKMTVAWTMTTDGEPHPFHLRGSRGTARATWRGETLVIESSQPGHAERIQMMWSPDHRSLICAGDVRDRSGSGPFRYVFEKKS